MVEVGVACRRVTRAQVTLVRRGTTSIAAAGALLTIFPPPAVRAEVSLSDLAAKIERLETENRKMRDDITKLRTQTRTKADNPRFGVKTADKVDELGRTPARAVPPSRAPARRIGRSRLR